VNQVTFLALIGVTTSLEKKIGVSILVYIVVWCNDHQWEWVCSSNSTKCQKIV